MAQDVLRLQLLRDTQANHANFVGRDGEVTVVTDDHSLRVHDGVTPGGNSLDTLPDQTGNSGKFLKTVDGEAVWEDVKTKSDVDYVQQFDDIYDGGIGTDEKTAWEVLAESLEERLDHVEDVLSGASARQILEIFYTLRTDTAPINGAYDCNGRIFDASDFVGEHNPYDLLVQGKAPTCTFSEYQAELDEYGSCGKFGLDRTNRQFRVPTLKNILQPTILASELGKIVEAGLPNIVGSVSSALFAPTNTTTNATGAFSDSLPLDANSVVVWTSNQSNNQFRNSVIKLNALHSSPLYKDNFNTVQPQTIYARAMVQLATRSQEISIEQYEQQLSQYVQTATLNGRLIGEIIQSMLPINDAGVHLLDGGQILKTGIYKQFCDYVVALQTTHPNLFCTQAEFDSAVSTYGSCGKFVIGADYIRLPKVSDILQGTTDLGAVGDLVEAGLPNIVVNSGSPYNLALWTAGGLPQNYGALSATDSGFAPTGQGTYGKFANFTFNASRSSPYYRDDVTKPTPQTIKSLLYICVATAIKSPVEVDIDEIATDLNGKLDKSGGTMTGRLYSTKSVYLLGDNADPAYRVGISAAVHPDDGTRNLNVFDERDRRFAVILNDFPDDGTWCKAEAVYQKGNNFIRYVNGIQFCWGASYYAPNIVITYEKPFVGGQIGVSTGSSICTATNWNNTNFTMQMSNNASTYCAWIAIGRWK